MKGEATEQWPGCTTFCAVLGSGRPPCLGVRAPWPGTLLGALDRCAFLSSWRGGVPFIGLLAFGTALFGSRPAFSPVQGAVGGAPTPPSGTVSHVPPMVIPRGGVAVGRMCGLTPG